MENQISNEINSDNNQVVNSEAIQGNVKIKKEKPFSKTKYSSVELGDPCNGIFIVGLSPGRQRRSQQTLKAWEGNRSADLLQTDFDMNKVVQCVHPSYILRFNQSQDVWINQIRKELD